MARTGHESANCLLRAASVPRTPLLLQHTKGEGARGPETGAADALSWVHSQGRLPLLCLPFHSRTP